MDRTLGDGLEMHVEDIQTRRTLKLKYKKNLGWRSSDQIIIIRIIITHELAVLYQNAASEDCERFHENSLISSHYNYPQLKYEWHAAGPWVR